METNPDLNGLSMRDRFRLADTNLLDAQFVAGQHLHADTVPVHRLPRLGHAAEPFAHHAADGCGFDIFFAMEAPHQPGDAVQIEVAGYDKAALPILLHVAIRLVLVANLTDDHFQQIFHGGESGSVAVFIHHDNHVGAFLLHLAHQVVYGLGLGNKRNRANQFANRAALPLLFLEFEHVADVHEPDDLIDILVEGRNPRVLLVDHELAQFFESGIGRDGPDVGT